MMRLCSWLGTVLVLFLFASACTPAANEADFILTNGNIYTVDDNQPRVEAVAVAAGKILALGSAEEMASYQGRATQMLDVQGATVVPGLIESHGHFLGLGQFKRNLDLTQVKNYEELIAVVEEAVANAPEGEWILGRGWHQSKWEPQPELVVGYQTHEALSAVSPNHPVYLAHASGHAGFANAKAMEIAGIGAEERVVEFGEIIRYPDGQPTGIFTELAENFITDHIPKDSPASLRADMQAAIEECLANGLTSFQDAGSNQQAIDIYQEFVEEDKMKLRLWVMLSGGNPDLLSDWYAKGPVTDDLLSVKAIKLYADGALGSRGAWLLKPYTDRPSHYGNPLMPMEEVQEIAKKGLEHGFQVCTHAIGDRANQEVLNQYQRAFEAYPEKKDHRFRIEHAQHLALEDIPRFSELGVIASMQAIHMSSDRPWAIFRLGQKRILDGAYVWQKLLQSGAKVINGTDTPVEPVSPIACFYASVTRQTLAGMPIGGYEPEQKMTREQALRAYTLDAAYGAFEEDLKGSIEVGKFADFTVLSQDIMTVPDDQLLATEVTHTIVGGKVVYEK
ncbi:MAG: amidohydrolase [Bacteroidota bacterium]